MSLFTELKRRNVFRVAAAYLVVGWLLTEVLTTLLPAFGAAEWVSRAVMLIFALGFLPTIVLSWIYEITPDGIKLDHEVDRDDPDVQASSRRLEYFTIASVVAGIIVVAIFSARPDAEESATALLSTEVVDASVAVLPFVNMSGSEENEYFSDGLTETLLHMLAQIPELKVAARTSSFAFRDQNKTIGEIATALGVAHVLEGSVQRAGDQVRITAQLIRAADGFHVWSENYDLRLDDIFGVQDEIAEKVGGALSASLLGTPDTTAVAVAGATTDVPDAYDLYLQAINSRTTFSHGELEAAERLLKGALTVDPDFLEAKTELANNYLHQVETGLLDQVTAYPEAIALADQVLVNRPDDVDARAIRIFASAADRAQREGPQTFFAAVSELEEIVAEAPEALAPRILLTRFYQGLQQADKAIPLMQQALEKDPFNPRIHYELGNLHMALEHWDKARDALQRSLELEPVQPNVLANLANVSLQLGDGLDYLRRFLQAMQVDPADYELPGMIANFLYELDLIEEGDDFRDRVLAIAPTSEVAYQMEMVRAINIGDEVGSVASARRAIEDDIDDRRFSYGGAVQHLLRVAAKQGTVEAESLYLEQNAPGILDIDAETTPLKYRGAQFAAFDAWYVALPRDDLLSRLQRFGDIAVSFGFTYEQNPEIHVTVLVYQGQIDEAIEIALAEVFTDSVGVHLDWRRVLSQAQYSEFVEDPRIQGAMQRWEDEEAAMKGQVQAFLADLSVSS